MSRFSIVLWDHEYDIKFQLGAFDRIPEGWWKFSSWFQWEETKFQVAQTSLSKYLKEPEPKVKEKKRETKRRPNKTKKSKKSARKGRKVH